MSKSISISLNTPILDRVWSPKFLEKESNTKKLAYHVSVASTVPFAFLGDMIISLVAKPLGYELFAPRKQSGFERSVNWVKEHKVGIVVTTTVLAINTFAITYGYQHFNNKLSGLVEEQLKNLTSPDKAIQSIEEKSKASKKSFENVLNYLLKQQKTVSFLDKAIERSKAPKAYIHVRNAVHNKAKETVDNLLTHYLKAKEALASAISLKEAFSNGTMVVNCHKAALKTVNEMKRHLPKITIDNLLKLIDGK